MIAFFVSSLSKTGALGTKGKWSREASGSVRGIDACYPTGGAFGAVGRHQHPFTSRKDCTPEPATSKFHRLLSSDAAAPVVRAPYHHSVEALVSELSLCEHRHQLRALE